MMFALLNISQLIGKTSGTSDTTIDIPVRMSIQPIFDRTGCDESVQIRSKSPIERILNKFRRQEPGTGQIVRDNDDMCRRTPPDTVIQKMKTTIVHLIEIHPSHQSVFVTNTAEITYTGLCRDNVLNSDMGPHRRKNQIRISIAKTSL